jgi:hypothetical protein
MRVKMTRNLQEIDRNARVLSRFFTSAQVQIIKKLTGENAEMEYRSDTDSP